MLLERAAEEREHAGVLAKFQVERGANVKVCSFFVWSIKMTNFALQILALDAQKCDEICKIEQAIDGMLNAEVNLCKILLIIRNYLFII